MNKQQRDDLRACINSGLQYDGGVILRLLDYADDLELAQCGASLQAAAIRMDCEAIRRWQRYLVDGDKGILECEANLAETLKNIEASCDALDGKNKMTIELFKFIDRFIPAKWPYLCHECAKPLHLDAEIKHDFCDNCCETLK